MSCSRKVICEVVNEPTEASSITALTWFSNSTGSTTRFCGTTRSSAELIGIASVGMSGDQPLPLVHRALSDQALAELHE